MPLPPMAGLQRPQRLRKLREVRLQLAELGGRRRQHPTRRVLRRRQGERQRPRPTIVRRFLWGRRVLSAYLV